MPAPADFDALHLEWFAGVRAIHSAARWPWLGDAVSYLVIASLIAANAQRVGSVLIIGPTGWKPVATDLPWVPASSRRIRWPTARDATAGHRAVANDGGGRDAHRYGILGGSPST